MGDNHVTLMWIAALVGMAFVFAFGAIVGSFLNVVIYRMPEGLGIVRPPSACPRCGTHLRWFDNLPIVGWIALGGKCRYCKSKISPQYVLIELLVALIFAGTYALWFMEPTFFPRVWAQTLSPEWTDAGVKAVWPVGVLLLALVSSLIAITIIDARTFLIPLAIPTSITIAALVVHPAGALMFDWMGRRPRPDWPSPWTLDVPDGGAFGAALAGFLGLLLSVALLSLRIVPQSFADYEEWEKRAQADLDAAKDADDVAHPEPGGPSLREVLTRTFLLTAPAVALMAVGAVLGSMMGQPYVGLGVGSLIGLLIGLRLRLLAMPEGGDDEPTWLAYPHARREMGKETLFLVPIALLGVAGWWACAAGGPLEHLAADPPRWLGALAGSVLGLLVGGGVVWLIRILGTLAFGKEAMGLGDVHMMASVGAVLGWIDPTLAFFTAPFFGIAWAILGGLFAGRLGKLGTALPFGPHLALATILVVYAKPFYEWAAGAILGNPINFP